MAYSIYGKPYKPTERVFYGTVDTMRDATTELRRLRRAGIADVYAIGFDPDIASLTVKGGSKD
jgi:hypothetical protein